MDEFRAGVTATLRSWSALRTAVETGWGGSESVGKAEVLRGQIFEIFSGGTPKGMTDVTDLEDALAIFMEEEFSVVLEDGSEKQIADVIWKMYEACVRGDIQLANQAVVVAEQAVAKLNQGYFPVQIVAPENADDSDDDENDDANGHVNGQANSSPAVEATDNTSGLNVPTPPNDPVGGIAIAVAATPVPDEASRTRSTTAAEYAAQPLFGTTKKRKTVDQPPPRQLGENPVPAPESNEATMDEDGFAPVTKQKRRSRNSV